MMTKMTTGSAPADPDGAAPTEEEKSPGSKTSYECRFCLMKFEKSQALGGHMNRHRQEREKEQYQQAQELLNSLAQQQMSRNWSSLTPEIPQLPSDPALSRMSSQFTGGATRSHAPPPISFGSYNRGVQAPTSASNPSSVSTNYYVPSNSSGCNNNNNNNNNVQQQHQQQNQHWNADGYSTAAARSTPQAASFHALEISARGVPQEVFANMLRASATNSHNHNHNSHNNNNNKNDSSLVSSGTPTNTPQAPYDMYSSLPTYFGGM